MNAAPSRHAPTMLPFFALLLGACSVTIEPNPGNSNLNANDSPQEPLKEFVTIRFVNASPDQALNVEFFATNDPLDVLPDDLFADDTFRVRESIGLAGSGLLGPGSEDEIQFDCTDMLAIGTLGGEFRDNETGEVLGRGDELFKAPGGFSLCGGTAVFTYSPKGEVYQTRFTFE